LWLLRVCGEVPQPLSTHVTAAGGPIEDVIRIPLHTQPMKRK
jgi:hypothetical protein